MGYRFLNARINSANDACMWCENFVKFGPVLLEFTDLIIVNIWYDTAKKLAYLVEYLPIY